VGFDQDLLKLQASDAEAVRFEKTLLRDSGRSSWFAVALAPTRKLAEREADRFRKLPEVSDVGTIGTYIPDRQDEKMLILAHLNAELQPITVRPAQPEIPSALMRELNELDTKLDVIAPYDPSGGIGKTASLASQAIFRLRADPTAFSAYSRHIADDLGDQLTAFKAQLNGGGITEANLPGVLRERFIGASGTYLVQIYPKGDVWEDAPLQRFISGLRSVDRNVTGPPVQTYAIATVMRQGYERAAVLALIAVFVFVFADFRNPRDTLLATVPLIFGAAWLLETMGALRWDFNLANLFAVPILIGMGVDNGVNMLYRWREERDKSSLILTKAVGKSVTICSLTTIAAFCADPHQPSRDFEHGLGSDSWHELHLAGDADRIAGAIRTARLKDSARAGIRHALGDVVAQIRESRRPAQPAQNRQLKTRLTARSAPRNRAFRLLDAIGAAAEVA
jgi:uncharacterized protein